MESEAWNRSDAPVARLVLPLRRLSVLDALDDAVAIFRSQFKEIAKVGIFSMTPTILMTIVGSAWGASISSQGDQTTGAIVEGLFGLGANVAYWFGVIFMSVAVAKMLSERLRGGRMTAGEAIRASMGKFGSVIGSGIVSALLLGGAIILMTIGFMFVLAIAGVGAAVSGQGAVIAVAAVVMVIGGLAMILLLPVFLSLVLFIGPAISEESLGGIAAVERSSKLARSRFKASYGYALGVSVLQVLFSMVFVMIVFLIMYLLFLYGGLNLETMETDPRFTWVLNLVQTVTLAITACFVAPAMAVANALMYFNLRYETEGLDIELAYMRGIDRDEA